MGKRRVGGARGAGGGRCVCRRGMAGDVQIDCTSQDNATAQAGKPRSSRRTSALRGRARDVLLEVEDIHSYYGHIHALRGVSLTVEEGEAVTLVGSNGAGKNTTLRSIHGVLPPREGRIVFRGDEIQGVRRMT